MTSQKFKESLRFLCIPVLTVIAAAIIVEIIKYAA